MISVIVPSYNVEPYLERSVASIIGQAHKELEVMLVDDVSTEGTGALCNQLALDDQRIKGL